MQQPSNKDEGYGGPRSTSTYQFFLPKHLDEGQFQEPADTPAKQILEARLEKFTIRRVTTVIRASLLPGNPAYSGRSTVLGCSIGSPGACCLNVGSPLL